MPRNQDAVLLFMGSVDCPCFPTALGLIDLLEEMDKYGSLRTATDVFFWAKLQWRRKGITRESLTAAYLEFKQNDIRGKAREKKRRQRSSPEMSPEKGDKLGDNAGDNSGDKTEEMSPEMSPEKGDNAGDSLPSPSSPSPAPFLPPSPPTPPVTPYNPPNPNPVIPSQITSTKISRDTAVLAECAQVRERLNIDSAWETSERARMATAHRIVDWIRASQLPSAKYNTLYDLIYSSLDMGVSPDTIIAAALTDNGNSFSGDLSNAQYHALKKRGLL